MFKPYRIINRIARIREVDNRLEFDRLRKQVYEVDPETQIFQDSDDGQYFEVEFPYFEGYKLNESDPFIKVEFESLFLKATLCPGSTLNLSGTQVTDVSALGSVHTLGLSHTYVTDVSALGNVHTLNLRSTYVTDVSALGSVHTLDLVWTQVTDVSMLPNVNIIQ